MPFMTILFRLTDIVDVVNNNTAKRSHLLAISGELVKLFYIEHWGIRERVNILKPKDKQTYRQF